MREPSLRAMAAIALLALVATVPLAGPAAAVTNMLANGSFEATGSSWLSPWQFAVKTGGGGSIAQTSSTRVDGSYSAAVSITAASSSSPWLVQLSQSNLPLSTGNTYNVSFAVKASSGRSIEAILQQTASPYTVYTSKTVSLTTSWQSFSFAYSSTATNSNVSLRFNLAAATGSIWIDNVWLTDSAPSPTPTPSSSSTVGKGATLAKFVEFWGSNTAGMNSDLSDLAAGNISWARVDLQYTSSPNPNFDALVWAAHNRGLRLLVTVIKNPPTNDLGTASEQALYQSWLASMVVRYRYWVKDWEIQNEPNLHYSWNIDESTGSDPVAYAASVQRYVTLLQEGYSTIKANDPTATVFIGGLSEWTMERYMSVLLTTAAYRYFDVMSFHPYGPDPSHDVGRLSSLKYEMSLNSSFASKPIWITEVGFNTSWTSKAGYVTSEQQKADYLAQTLVGLHNDGAQLPIFWYTLHEYSASSGYGLESKSSSTLAVQRYPAFYRYRDLTW